MFRMALRITSLAIGIAALASTGAVLASDQSTYVFSSWQAGAVGNCLVTDKHMTADCESAPGVNGYRPPAQFAEIYLNNQMIPGAPVGKRAAVMIKLREPLRGQPPDAAQTAITEVHLHDLQRQFYPHAALAAKLEGRASADCIVRDNGQLDTCWIADETPAGAGFGEATLNVINLMKLTSPLPADRKRSFDMAWRLPAPVDQVFVNCLITSDFTTRDCTTDPDPDYPGAAQAVLNSLTDQPLHLSGAPIGQRIEIALIRSELKQPQTIGGRDPETAPYKPVRLTALNANDVLYYYPPLSVRLAETGYTDVKCKVTDDGRLNECWISNNPNKSDRLGHAHLRLTEIVRMQPPAANSPIYDRRSYAFRVAWALND
jgi:hypothetical protein